MRILLVEDQTDLGAAIKRVLAQETYLVDWVQDGNEAWNYLDNREMLYTLGIFDWLLPSVSGLDLLKRLRSRHNPLPVLMLTAKDTMDDRVKGLDSGADDYLIKPFLVPELLARVRALHRRSPQLRSPQLQIGNLILNCQTKTVWLAETGAEKQVLQLTAKEFQFLEYFMHHSQQIITSDQLLTHLWEFGTEPMSNVVAAQVRLLRRKLAELGCDHWIETVYGLGYRFSPNP